MLVELGRPPLSMAIIASPGSERRLSRTVGTHVAKVITKDVFLAAVRNLAGFSGLLTEAEACGARAARAFAEGGGLRVLSAI